MSLEIVGALIVILLVFIVWLSKRNERLGRVEAEGEILSEHAETLGEINDFERRVEKEDNAEKRESWSDADRRDFFAHPANNDRVQSSPEKDR